MIYVDSSVALAQLLAENRTPPEATWNNAISSRLLEYEVWNVIHRRNLSNSHAEVVGLLLRRIAYIEMTPAVLARALDPYPRGVRTLDALHLASASYLTDHGQKVQLATYDRDMRAAATALGLPLLEV